jgi:hypothetical protein
LIEGARFGAVQDAADQVRLSEQITQPNLAEFRVVYQPIVDVATATCAA